MNIVRVDIVDNDLSPAHRLKGEDNIGGTLNDESSCN